MAKNNRAVGYCRVSTIAQVYMMGPEGQLDAIRQVCKAEKLCLRGVFMDSVSREEMYPPAWEAVCEAVRQGKFTHIVVEAMDRVPGNAWWGWMAARSALEKTGGRLYVAHGASAEDYAMMLDGVAACYGAQDARGASDSAGAGK